MTEPAASEVRGRPAPSALAVSFFAAGALATASQVLLLRELIVGLGGDEAGMGLGLASWLAGIAVGAWVARRGGHGSVAGIGVLALALPGGIATARLLRLALAPAPGELPGLGLGLALAAAAMLPSGAAVGWTFTALASGAARAWPEGVAIARLYVFESAGSLVGGLAATFILVPSILPLRAALLAGGAACALAWPAARRGLVAGRIALLSAAAVLAAAMPFAARIEQATLSARFRGAAPGVELADSVETPYQHLDLGGQDVRYLYAGGQYTSSFPDPTASETAAHMLATLCERPRRVLAFGGIERGVLRFLLRHPVESVVLVEPDSRALAFVSRHLPSEDREALGDPRVRIVGDDPRRVIASSRESYDLIAVVEPDPVTLLRARFSTAEFFRLCAARLAPQGVVVVALRTAPNVLTAETAALGGAVFGALRAAFEHVAVTPGPDSLLVAGGDAAAASLDPQVLAARWRARGLASEVFAAELFPLLLEPVRVAAQTAALAGAAHAVAPSRDDRPVSFLHALARRQRIGGSLLGRGLAAVLRSPPVLLVGLLLLPSLAGLALSLARPRPEAAVQHAVAVAGAAAMCWSLSVLFAFQTQAGSLYGQLGVLTAVFMLGLACGGQAASRLGGSPSTLQWLVALATGFSLLLPFGLRAAASWQHALATHGLLLLAAGAVTGALFPVAVSTSMRLGHGPREAAARVEAADHLGAALAALVAAVVCIPVFGLAGTAWLFAALLAIAWLRLWLGP
jgi:spermidine synthase